MSRDDLDLLFAPAPRAPSGAGRELSWLELLTDAPEEPLGTCQERTPLLPAMRPLHEVEFDFDLSA